MGSEPTSKATCSKDHAAFLKLQTPLMRSNRGRKTIINARIDAKGDFVEEGAQVEIGGDDRYIAVCRKCWRNKRIEQSSRISLPFLELNTHK